MVAGVGFELKIFGRGYKSHKAWVTHQDIRHGD